METKLDDMSLVDLKAYAYDLINTLENTQRMLNAVNQKIGEKSQAGAPKA